MTDRATVARLRADRRAEAECAHCSDGQGNASMDTGRRIPCPACLQRVCPSCAAMSGPTTCGTYADGDENMEEIRTSEARIPSARLRRRRALARASCPMIRGDQYPLQALDQE